MVTFASDERKAYAWASDEIVFSLNTKAHVVRGSEAHKAISANPVLATHQDFTHCAMIADNWTHQFLNDNGIPFETASDSLGCVRQVSEGRQSVYLHFIDTTQSAVEELQLGDDFIALPKIYSSAPFRLLLSKNSEIGTEFVSDFDTALAAMRADGSYDRALETIRLMPAEVIVATLEWPPYTASELANGGAVTEVVRKAFEDSAIETNVVFLPWKRAVAYAADERENVIGYFPGYHCNHHENQLASDVIGEGPPVLAERVDNDITWSTLDDLEGKNIGVVVGYANTEEFDKRVADGRIRGISSVGDAESLVKLAKGRLDAAIIDRFVMQYLVRTDPALKPYADQLRVDERPLEDKNLYLCLRDDPRNRHLLKLFNEGLRNVRFDDVWAMTLSKLRNIE